MLHHLTLNDVAFVFHISTGQLQCPQELNKEKYSPSQPLTFLTVFTPGTPTSAATSAALSLTVAPWTSQVQTVGIWEHFNKQCKSYRKKSMYQWMWGNMSDGFSHCGMSWHHNAVFPQTQTALYWAEAPQLRLQMQPNPGSWGAEGVYRLGLWGCSGERLFWVFSIQPKSSKTSSSLLRAASWDLI